MGVLRAPALLLGAGVGFFARVPQRLIAAVMAFGGGVLISALSFDLMDEAFKRGGFDSTAIGFLSGAALYTAANWYLARQGLSTGSVRVSNNQLKMSTVEAV